MTAFAFLAGIGTFGPTSASGDTVSDQPVLAAATITFSGDAAEDSATTEQEQSDAEARTDQPKQRLTGTGLSAPSNRPAGDADGSDADAPLPADSGDGRRVVFDMSQQRVWLVDDGEQVQKTYLVSGSVTDNLKPGSYEVFSRSRYASGIDASGTMQYFVRFTRGERAAIGFHDIPMLDGRPLQTTDQLGTPQSHGCIRQAREDAVQLWDFAPLGTAVDVVA